jgi:DNA polymerase-1
MDYSIHKLTKVKDLPTRLQDEILIIDTECTGLDKMDDKPFMFLFSVSQDETIYAVEWSNQLVKWLNDTLKKIKLGVFHNAKYDLHMFTNGGVDTDVIHNLPIHCSYVTQALIDEHRFTYGLDDLGFEFFNISKRNEELYQYLGELFNEKPSKKLMDRIQYAPRELTAYYGVGDIEITKKLYMKQVPEIKKEELDDVFSLEMNVLKALVEMERRGVHVNLPFVDKVGIKLEEEFHKIQKDIIEIVGWPVNPRSPLQMVDAFNKLKIPIKFTKTGRPSFAKDIFENLDHPFITALEESRSVKTLLETFVNGSVKGHHRNSYVHTNFNQTRSDDTGTRTGRISSSDPNLQQIPNPKRAETQAQKERCKLIRSFFIPENPNNMWIKNDWEQFEFRLFAHFVKDPALTKRYNDDPHTDFHTALVEMINWTMEQRPKAKQINLGLVFGMGDGKLAQELKLPYTIETGYGGKEYLKPGPEAEAIFNEYHSRFPNAKKFLKMASNLAKQRGYIKTLSGRRIRFPGGQFTHKAGGLVFQGSAADIMKQKTIELNDKFRNTDIIFNLVVHDEFNLNAHKSIVKDMAMEVKKITEDVSLLRIPILADSKIGPSWGEVK